MTKKDYEAIAEAIKASTPVGCESVLAKRELVLRLCNYFGKQNIRFDAMKFIKAANYNESAHL